MAVEQEEGENQNDSKTKMQDRVVDIEKFLKNRSRQLKMEESKDRQSTFAN